MDELITFLLAANTQGYSTGDEKVWKKEQDGSTTIGFEKGKWKMNDNFFGGEPFGGRTVIFKKKKAYWMMVYYGAVAQGENLDVIYKFLRQALAQPPKNMPIRGPKSYGDSKLKYTNGWKGKFSSFIGSESITKSQLKVYETFYAGGLVDQRKEV